MNRRHFIKLSSLSLLPILSCNERESSFFYSKEYKIEMQSDRGAGHLIFEATDWVIHSQETTVEYLIVGGGVAGLSAAAQLKDKDCLLCELSTDIGGTSGAQMYQNQLFCQGAHYDLVYPNYFGEEALSFLESLKIIYFDRLSNQWTFVDKQYIISGEQESQCFSRERYREDVLADNEYVNHLFDLLSPYIGQMKLPTRLISNDFKTLNSETFFDFLKKKMLLPAEMKESIDYQMIDDFGGTSEEVSALTGIYYYTSRPYYSEANQVFSPPEGNNYYVNKIADAIPVEKVLRQHLVKKIEKKDYGFEATVLDLKNKSIKKIRSKKVIYAGQKHALKYVFPSDYSLFQENIYAPWMVINFILKIPLNTKEVFWQNEVILPKKGFLGFVNSEAQNKTDHKYSSQQILTAYYCLSSLERSQLVQIEKNAQNIVNDTVERICRYYKMDKEEIDAKIDRVFVKLMGHAMPVPAPNYLFNDKNMKRSEKGLVYAGVDNARLPLFMEAIDSGLEAVKLIM